MDQGGRGDRLPEMIENEATVGAAERQSSGECEADWSRAGSAINDRGRVRAGADDVLGRVHDPRPIAGDTGVQLWPSCFLQPLDRR